MINDEIKEERISIFNKIKMFFKRIININSEQKLLSENSQNTLNDNISTNTDFLENIKVNINYEYDKGDKLKIFMKELEENIDLVENFSDERLDKLISYYEKLISEKEEKIKRLKKSLV